MYKSMRKDMSRNMNKDIRNRLIAYRNDNCLPPITVLAEEIGITRSYLTMFMNGKVSLGYKKLQAIEKFLIRHNS